MTRFQPSPSLTSGPKVSCQRLFETYASALGRPAVRTYAQIAADLFLSPHTVRTHARNSLSKLGMHTRAEAVLAVDRAESSVPPLRP
ncbi:MAG TPA: helix-turn-helix transcriptional regulator [Solirubrobacteraceae bacterium]|nr:helix-turn-helix transcriptional regulator [Solirubrobacteraceae bacterium]